MSKAGKTTQRVAEELEKQKKLTELKAKIAAEKAARDVVSKAADHEPS